MKPPYWTLEITYSSNYIEFFLIDFILLNHQEFPICSQAINYLIKVDKEIRNGDVGGVVEVNF
jgi:hypothetical protein